MVQHPGLIMLESTFPVDCFSEVNHEVNGIFCDNICSGPICVFWLVVLDSGLSRSENILLKFIWRNFKFGSGNCLFLDFFFFFQNFDCI